MSQADECRLGSRRNPCVRRAPKLITAALSVIAVVSCSSSHGSMSLEEKRNLLLDLEDETLAELVEKAPAAQGDIDRAMGYAIFSNKTTKVPFVGTGEGIGVVVNKETGNRTYLKVTRFDVGGGLGVRSYREIILYFDEEAFRKLASGKLKFGVGVEAGAGKEGMGTGGGGTSGSRKESYATYELSEAGVSATWTVRMIRYSVLDLGD